MKGIIELISRATKLSKSQVKRLIQQRAIKVHRNGRKYLLTEHGFNLDDPL